MEIRAANAGDAAMLHAMNERFNGPGSNTPEQLAASLAHNTHETVFIAVAEGEAAGFCCVQLFKSMCYSVNYAEITELYVEEAYRRQGVASRLMAFAEAYFQEENVRSYQLFTGEQNKEAQACYEKMGYARSPELMYRKRIYTPS